MYLGNFVNNLMGVWSLSKGVHELSKENSHKRHSNPIHRSSNCAYNHQQDICRVCKWEQLVEWNSVFAVIFSSALLWVLLILCLSGDFIIDRNGIVCGCSLIWADALRQAIVLSHVASCRSCDPPSILNSKTQVSYLFKAYANEYFLLASTINESWVQLKENGIIIIIKVLWVREMLWSLRMYQYSEE